MLRELHISNLAVIEDVVVELDRGLTCFTGQTGAGKSLILGAFEILLGMRCASAAEVLRPGADEGRVSGVFELRDARLAKQVAAAADLSLEGGEPLLITRKFFASGRSSVSVNGQPATATMVRAIGELMVDVHGQHDHQYLLKPSNQLLILDEFARCMDLREQFARTHGELRDLRRRYAQLSASRTLRRQQLELYEFQAGEIDAATLEAGEYQRWRDRHTFLSNLARIKREAGSAHAALYENEGAVVERLQMIGHVLADLSELDQRLREVADAVRAATAALQDAAFDLGRHVDRLELDPAELGEVEERLNLINRLVAKYTDAPGAAAAGGDPVAAVLAYRRQIESQIVDLRGQDADLGEIEVQIGTLERRLTEVGGKLSAARRVAGLKLRPLVQTQMRDLGMLEAEFDVDFASAAASTEDGEGAGPESASGLDQVEMLVRTNPGQPARPLRKIASGGELSRIMLAIKSILAQADRVSVLVFDEIDANIGGRMGTVIGEKLRSLAGNGGQQVLCITHLPQIAAFADRHLRIAKEIAGKGKSKQTRTTVTPLTGEARIDELAEMLAGQEASATTRAQAKELLDTAAGGRASSGGGKRKSGKTAGKDMSDAR